MKKSLTGLTVSAIVISSVPLQADAATSYTVKSGDTLWGISQKNNVSVQKLMEYNGLSNTILKVGQVLKLTGNPTSGTSYKTHTVKGGDTLWAISQKYNVSVAQIQTLNQLSSTVLYVGQVLKVGTGTSTNPPTTPSNPAPSVTTYKVVAGDTLYKISRDYDISVEQIMKLNNLTSTALKIGQVLKVTAQTTPSPNPTPAVREATVTASALYVRKTPEGEQVGILPNGARVKLGETQGDWTHITYGNLKGWVHNGYLQEVSPSTPTTPAPNNGKVVVIDPGHGGADPGAVNGSHYEKTYTTIYANKVKYYLEQKGYRVYLTRTGDTSCYVPYSLNADLSCRVQKAKSFNGDILVSIHMNSLANPGVQKTETYYNARNDYDGNMNPFPTQSKKLAEKIHARYQPAFGSGNGGIINNNLYMNRMADMPAVLLEVGYLSSPNDLAKIKNTGTQDRVSSAIAQGIHEYFNN